MTGKLQHLRHLGAWCDEWCNPIVFAIYREDEPECLAALAAARADLERGLPPPGDVQALQFQLAYHEFQARCHFGGKGDYREALWRELIERLQEPPVDDVARRLRDCLVLILRVTGDTRGHAALSEAELEGLVKAIPLDLMDAELWFYVSSWAVEHRNRNFIELAYAEMLTEPGGYLRHDIWLRVNLMHLIFAGRAQERDVLETIRVYKHLNQLERFEETLLPVVREAGLGTPALLAAIAQKRAELSAIAPEPPRV